MSEIISRELYYDFVVEWKESQKITRIQWHNIALSYRAIKENRKRLFLISKLCLELLMEQQVPKTHFDFSIKIKSFKTLLYGYFFNILSKFFISFFKFHFYLNLIKFFTFVQ